MIWLSQGGGPWGTGPRGGGPWGGRGNGGGSGGGRGPQPPNFEDILRRGQDRFRRLVPGGFGIGSGIVVVIAAIVLIWLASGFFRVQPDEVGVVLRFGAYNRTTEPGLHYHLPGPIETVLRPAVTRVNRTAIGFHGQEGQPGQAGADEQVPQEALMLTGDENIVDINFTVFWVIKDARQYLFDIRSPERTVKSAAESAMREIVGETPIASALAEGRGKIETDTQALLQQILNSYGAGIEITEVQLQKVDPPAPVIDAFRDVQRARADQDRQRNIADSYRNAILPRARGTAAQIVQEAEAYRQQVVARAEGDADRFRAVEQAYRSAKDVTLQRIYLDTMADILKDSRKVIIDKNVGGVLPVQQLPSLGGAVLSKPAPPSGTASGVHAGAQSPGSSYQGSSSQDSSQASSPADTAPGDAAPTDTMAPDGTSPGDAPGSELRNER